MPKFQPVNILGGCYSDSDRSWSLQDTVNWLPEQAEQSETRTPTQFKTPPGLKPFLQVNGPNASKPVRATYNCEGRLFAAIGKGFYQITNAGIAVEEGTIPGNTRVTMAHNQISQGNQLVAVNGSSGYVYNTLTQVFEKIVDAGFPGAIWVGFADGYILGIEPGRRFAFNSEPADALNYNTLDRFTSEYKPDLIVTGIVNNNELILLNETSYEFFENTGATQQPFRSKRIYGDVGCASRYGACNLDRTVFMFGADGKFYRLESYSWQRISTRPIEQAIRGLNWSQVFCYAWDDAGHSVVYWTFPDGFTWGFDQSTQLWHRRKSLGLDRWRPNTATQLGQEWYVGDFQSGRIWRMDWDYILEGDDEIESERVTGVLSDNQNLAIVNRLELLFGSNAANKAGEGAGSTIPVPFPVQPDGPTITGDPPDPSIGVFYTFSYTITAGDAPIETVEIISGSIPEGMTLSSAGVLFGTPVSDGDATFEFRIRVEDENGIRAYITSVIELTAFVSAYLPLNTDFTDLTGRTWALINVGFPVSCQPTPTADGLGSLQVDLTFNFTSAYGIKSVLGTGAPGVGAFCFEGYLYVGSDWNTFTNGYLGLISLGSGADYIDIQLRPPADFGDTTPVFVINNGASVVPNLREPLSKLTWYHFALCRDVNSDVWLYINGKKSAAALNDGIDLTAIMQAYIGSGFGAPYSFISNIDNCRLTTGWSRYTEDFTPPSAPMPYP